MYYAGDTVEITTGSVKTGNLRTLAGTVIGATTRPIEGTDREFQLYRVQTAEGVVIEAASRIALVATAEESAVDANIAQVQAAFDNANAVSDAPCMCDDWEVCGTCLAAFEAWDAYNALLDRFGLSDEDFREGDASNVSPDDGLDDLRNLL